MQLNKIPGADCACQLTGLNFEYYVSSGVKSLAIIMQYIFLKNSKFFCKWMNCIVINYLQLYVYISIYWWRNLLPEYWIYFYSLESYSLSYFNFIMIVWHFLSNFLLSNYWRWCTICLGVTVETWKPDTKHVHYNSCSWWCCPILPNFTGPSLKLAKCIVKVKKF